MVSIVSIQADQSRLGYALPKEISQYPTFQSYQFRQINPDFGDRFNAWDIPELVSIVSIQADQSRHTLAEILDSGVTVFQSYQFRQINPDLV